MDSAPATSPRQQHRRESSALDFMETAVPGVDDGAYLSDNDGDEDFLDIPILMDIAPGGAGRGNGPC